VRDLAILAVDPGPVQWGWALLVIHSTHRGTVLRWVGGDHEQWTTSLCVRLLDRAVDEARRIHGDVLVASEIVAGKVYRGRSDANVLDTARACGRATPVAEAMAILAAQGRLPELPPIATAEYTTHDWRAVLTGYKDAPQDAVNACVTGVVAELPPLPKRSAEHVYDALGLAIAAGHGRRGRASVPLPAPVAAQMQAIVEAARRAARNRRAALQVARALRGVGVDVAGLASLPMGATPRRRRKTKSAPRGT
jgi:hypothetical protein